MNDFLIKATISFHFFIIPSLKNTKKFIGEVLCLTVKKVTFALSLVTIGITLASMFDQQVAPITLPHPTTRIESWFFPPLPVWPVCNVDGGWGDGEGGVGGGGGEVVGGWGRQQQTRQKVPCFNVSRYNRVVFNRFAAKQCWVMIKIWVQPFFLKSSSQCTSATLFQALCPALSGSLWLPLALSGSLWLSIALRICLKIPFGSQTLPTDWFGRVKMDQWGRHVPWAPLR